MPAESPKTSKILKTSDAKNAKESSNPITETHARAQAAASAHSKQRGRSNITSVPARSPTHPGIEIVAKTQANRAGPGKGLAKHRGDRRDMSPTYTNNNKHASRGNNVRPDVTTRAR